MNIGDRAREFRRYIQYEPRPPGLKDAARVDKWDKRDLVVVLRSGSL